MTTAKGRARKPQPVGEQREPEGPGEHPAKHTPWRTEWIDTVGVLGGALRAMTAHAKENNSGYRLRGERPHRLQAV